MCVELVEPNRDYGSIPGLHENKLIQKSFFLKAIFSPKSNPPHSFFEMEPNTIEAGNMVGGSWFYIKAKWGEFGSAKMKSLIFGEKMEFRKNEQKRKKMHSFCNPGML